MDQLMTLTEVGAVLRLSRRTVERLIVDGELRSVRLGRNVRVTREDLRAYLNAVGVA